MGDSYNYQNMSDSEIPIPGNGNTLAFDHYDDMTADQPPNSIAAYYKSIPGGSYS